MKVLRTSNLHTPQEPDLAANAADNSRTVVAEETYNAVPVEVHTLVSDTSGASVHLVQ